MLPYSPTTLKKDKNGLSMQTTGFFQVSNNKLIKIEFIPDKCGKYLKKYDIIDNSKGLVLKRK